MNMKNISVQLRKWQDFIKSFCLLQVENDKLLKAKRIKFPFLKRYIYEYINYYYY